MKYAKVLSLNDKVEVIIKKIIVDGQAAISFNFVTELDEKMINMGLESIYSLKKKRDSDFDKLSIKDMAALAKNLPTFKDLI